MGFLKEGMMYLGESYWGLPNQKNKMLKELDRGNLYYKWGHEKGELLDYLQSYDCFEKLDLEEQSSDLKFDVYSKKLDCISEILRIKLNKAVESFDFLCQQRAKIELRDLNFKIELNDVIVEFMEFEENYFAHLAENKASLVAEEFEDAFKEARKNLLESSESKTSEVEQGIEAFYLRIKEYVEADSSSDNEDSKDDTE